MEAEEIQSVLGREPFVPLRVQKADGSKVDIPFRHAAVVLRGQGLLVFKGVKDERSRRATGYEVIGFDRIHRIEPRTTRGGSRRSRKAS
jgi:hypothetical protein